MRTRFRIGGVRPALFLVLAAQIALPGCIFTRDAVTPLKPVAAGGRTAQPVKGAVKAHLDDGSVVLFAEGYTLEGDVLRGTGERYDLTRREREIVDGVLLARVVALEAYRRETRPLATAFGIVGGALLMLPVGVGAILLLFVIS